MDARVRLAIVLIAAAPLVFVVGYVVAGSS